MATSTQAQRIPKLGNDEVKDYVKSMSLTQRAIRRVLRDRLTMTAIFVLTILSQLPYILTFLAPITSVAISLRDCSMRGGSPSASDSSARSFR